MLTAQHFEWSHSRDIQANTPCVKLPVERSSQHQQSAGRYLRLDAVGMGTREGNGQSELLITAGWSAVHEYHSGRIFLISTGIPPAPLTSALQLGY